MKTRRTANRFIPLPALKRIKGICDRYWLGCLNTLRLLAATDTGENDCRSDMWFRGKTNGIFVDRRLHGPGIRGLHVDATAACKARGAHESLLKIQSANGNVLSPRSSAASTIVV